MNEWIKVENGLPEIGETILGTDGRDIDIGFYGNQGKNNLYIPHIHKDRCVIMILTHWMRLPKAPVNV